MKRTALIASVALLLQLSACDWMQQRSPQQPETGAQTGQDLQPPPPAPPRKPPVPSLVVLAPATPVPIVTPDPEPLPPVANPDGLVGLDQPQVEALLGAPEQRSEAAPARIWHYAGRNCELEVYFYLDLKSQVMRALHYEVKSNEPSDPTRGRCFADLIAKHEAGISPASANPPR